MSNLLARFKKSKKNESFGLIGHRSRNELVDKTFDQVVSDNSITQEEAFLFAASRMGRFLGDEIKNLPKKNKSTIYNLIESGMLKHLPDLIVETKGQEKLDSFNKRIGKKNIVKNKKIIKDTIKLL